MVEKLLDLDTANTKDNRIVFEFKDNITRKTTDNNKNRENVLKAIFI